MLRFALGMIAGITICAVWLQFRLLPMQTRYEIELLRCHDDLNHQAEQYVNALVEASRVYR
jgi:hypothetical protein